MEPVSHLLKNIHKGWITSLFGVLIIVASIVCVFLPQTNWEWDKAIMGIGVGVAFLASPDPTKKTDVLSTAFVLGVLVLSIACTKYPVKSTTRTDSSWTKYTKDTMFVKGQSVKAIVNYDSIRMVLNMLAKYIANPKVVYNSPDAKQQLVFSLDKNGNVIADCTTSDKLIEYLSKEVNRLKTEQKTVIVNEAPPWIKYLLFASLAVNLILLVLLIIKK